MKFDFVVLGATGMQGKIVARDLLESGYSVLMLDKNRPIDRTLLNEYREIASFIQDDVSNVERLTKILEMSGADTVVNCVEGDWNLHVLQACINAGKHSIDLGSEIWMTKRQLKAHDVLKEKGLTHITGSGSVPGIGNVMLHHASRKFDTIDTIEVGFAWDSNRKEFVVPFSMLSIVEEFTGMAPVLENGRFTKKDPMNSIEERDFRGVGKQKCFIAGHHPEVWTFYKNYRHMGVKNIRFYAGFPDHSFEMINKLIDLGIGGQKWHNYYGNKIKPVDFLASVLRKTKPPEGYREKENLWLRVIGEKGGKEKTIEMDCLVPTLPGWEAAGCNIDTGLPTSIMAQMIKNGDIKERGAFSPESIVPTQPFFELLAERCMVIYENGRIINLYDGIPEDTLVVPPKMLRTKDFF
jgi:saccharopine dehydrogenase-like NADP-dependent oxidoreductase